MRVKLVLLILLASLFTAAARQPPTHADVAPLPGECQAGQTCHWLMYASSEAYVLCANGRFVIEVNGDDSILVRCEE